MTKKEQILVTLIRLQAEQLNEIMERRAKYGIYGTIEPVKRLCIKMREDLNQLRRLQEDSSGRYAE